MKLTKDMIGEMFMTRGGAVVCLEHRLFGITDYPAVFVEDTTHVHRTADGWYFETKGDRRDIVKHLPISSYPEYYL